MAEEGFAGPWRRRSRGHRLGEVFSVRLETFDNMDGEDCGNLYGTIKIVNGGGFFMSNIYDRERNDYESLKPGELFTLTGPSESINGYDTFAINFDLRNYDNDDEVIHQRVVYNARMDYSVDSDVLLTDTVVGRSGSLIVNYGVLRNAVLAEIELIVINNGGDGNDPDSSSTHVNVYGLLEAQYNHLRQEIRLFRISSEEPQEYIKVKSGEQIPLSRSAVAVSLFSNLTVRADLFCDCDGHGIANGSATFTPELSGTSTHNITGEYGEIEVKVTWINVLPSGGSPFHE